MLTRQQYEHTVERAVRMLKQAGIVITAEERARLEGRAEEIARTIAACNVRMNG